MADVKVYGASKDNPIDIDGYRIIEKGSYLLLLHDVEHEEFVLFSGKLGLDGFHAKHIFRSNIPLEAYIAYSEYKQQQEINSFKEFLKTRGIDPETPIS